jgi:hypothetical protein
LIFSFSRSQGGAYRAPLAPAKVLRSHAAVPTRRRSSRAPRVAGSVATAASKGSRSAAAASGGGPIVDHDHGGHCAVDSAGAGPGRRQSGGGGRDPGRGCPAARLGPVGEPARASPRAPAGVLLVRDDGGVASGRLADGAEASSSRGFLPASDGTAVRTKQEREHADAPMAHFASAQVSHLFFQRKPSANLYACPDQVSCI